VVRRPILYHVMSSGRGQVTAASELVPGPNGPAVELDPAVVRAHGVVVPIDPRRLVELDALGWIYGCPELVDRRLHDRRRPLLMT
jgi:hypothetical protein